MLGDRNRTNKKLRSVVGNKLKRKLRSEKGASITFGLLLFLICAVISSVVLVAGTSAAGRLSSMSTNEQRYYSVVSTAEVVKDMLDEKTETLIKTGSGIFVQSGNEYQIVNSDNPTQLDSLSKYIAYKICKSETITAEDALNIDLTGIVDDEKGKSVGIEMTYSNSENRVNLKNSCDNYSVDLILSTNENKIPVTINNNGETVAGEKIMYTWKVSD